MDLFTRLFGDLLAFVYHCFDRIVIHGYLTGLSRPEHVVHFFREVGGAPVIHCVGDRWLLVAPSSEQTVGPTFERQELDERTRSMISRLRFIGPALRAPSPRF